MIGEYTHIIIYVRVVGVVKQSPLVHFLRFLRPVELEQNVSAIYVRLRVIRPHADGLSVQHVRLFQARLIFGYQIGQVQQNVQVVGSNASLVRLAWFGFGQQ